jgi:Flp pilus assembly pilin Flp
MSLTGERAEGPRAPRLGRPDDGATAVEYALMAVLVAAVIAGIVTTVGQQLIGLFTAASAGFP